ncbi:PREDICTED: rhophilin-2 [Dipodomys ordii]|uniref:Rhophilin-2 n=1 Tax=Dipodomys ordii TaxID=10020 RepID=A0A1S3FZZ2_DIPOR|nr:PREDICTED: rhophilin-2 [Dipodomys ordii]
MTDALLPAAPRRLEKEGDDYFRKGCNPLAQTGRSKLQNERAALNQQILKAVRMRTGAENLLKVATNQKVREQVRLELSFVNSDLQMLKEELEGLNISVGVYQNSEVHDADIGYHTLQKYHLFACRTPSRDEAGVELLMSYFIQLGFVESRFFPPTCQMGLLFTWYDSLTGVPVSQQNLLLEKASILFNTGALYTQIGTRCDRQTQAGLESAVDAFQKAAETEFLDSITPFALGLFDRCFFEIQVWLLVAEVYRQLHTAMSQAPVKENIPYSWTSLACLKAHHYGALAHYFAATLLMDHQLKPGADEDHQEKCLSQLYTQMPEGLTPLATLKNQQQRQQLGKCHLQRAITHHEESLREASLCKKLRNIHVLQEVLTAAHQRTRLKYDQHREEDDILNLMEAPDIVSKTEQEVEVIPPQFSKVTVTDYFQKLGPLSVFSASKRWTPPRNIHFTAEEGDLGFTLRGNTPVQVHFLDPQCSAALAGTKEGDYIISIQDVDCKWLTVTEVMKLLKGFGGDEIDMKVVSLLDSTSSMPGKCATYSVGMQKTYSMICLSIDDDDDKSYKTKKVSKKLSFLSWGTSKNRQKSASTLCLPAVGVARARPQVKKKLLTPFSLLNSESSLY